MTHNNTIIKSPNDECEYKSFILDNKLNVFMAYDKNASISCVTMSVKIGYMYDSIPGMAHFLEHMLFNGTEKYPNENEFMAYTTKYGGYTNAFTSHNSTCYYYTIQSEHLLQSLDMFGNFFICPLFNKDSVNREKEAVNAEHTKNIHNDMWRFESILRYACTDTHPLKNFGTGSNKTLNVPDIHKHVKQFWETYYSSDLMTLFIVSNVSFNQLHVDVKDLFSKVPLKVNNQNRKCDFGKILNSPKLINVVPLEDTCSLSLNWEIPSFYTSPIKSPNNFLSHILGHEGKHSLHHTLTQAGYISSLSATIGKYVSDRCIFSIDMVLSPFGNKNRNTIIQNIIDFIKMLKNNIDNEQLKQLYDEIILIDKYEFKYMEKYDPESRCMLYDNIINMYNIQLDHILAIRCAHDKFKNIKKNLLTVLNCMTLDNMVMITGSKEFEKYDKLLIDEHYGTHYYVSNDLNLTTDLESTNKTFHELPILNTYISTDDFIEIKNQKVPRLIRNDKIKLFYLPSSEFKIPDVCVRAKIDIPLSLVNKTVYTKTLLYFNSIIAEINDEKYLCHMAGYKIGITFDMGKLIINIQGNYGKIHKVCEFIINSLMNSSLVSDKSFEKTKFVLSNCDKNMIFNSPYTRLGPMFAKKICPKFYDNYDRLNVVDSLFKENTMNVINDILVTSLVTVSIVGDIDNNSANNIGKMFDKFVPQNIYLPDIFGCDIYGTPSSCISMIQYPAENKHETNSAVGYYIFIDKIKYGVTENWNRSICLLNILDKIIGTEYFDQLRTQEKFGYVVNSSVYDVGDRRLLSKYYKFVVQSPDKKPDEIVKRTTNFIIAFKKQLADLSEDEYYKIVNVCIATLKMNYNNLDEMASFINLQIDAEYLDFTLKNALIQTYNKLTKDDLIHFYEEKFINRKAIVVCLTGNEKI